ncbi:MAG: citramalate synthase [Armatimonadota bacterium]
MEKILLYDTTLRDGAQTSGIAFSVKDKIHIAQHLDILGIDYIEGGWPSPTNQRDIEFFEEMRGAPLRQARLTVFGSTCRKNLAAENDPQLQGLLAAGTPVVCIFGKSWDLHVTEGLRATLDDNLRMIEDSVAFLRRSGVEVIYDAEHFFDGYRANPDYALATVQAAARGGAGWIVLCDTNGGSLPEQTREAMRAVGGVVSVPLGIHTHNDSELAVANTLTAVDEGARMVQGTINGYGERCGNANLCAIIPTLELKMGYRALPEGQLKQLYAAAHFVAEVANIHPPEYQAYVGSAAFSHKAGVHIDSVLKLKRSYEHIVPELVGNSTRMLVSDQAGGSVVVERAQRLLGITLDKKDTIAREVLALVKERENEGYEFESAEASFEMLLLRYLSLFDPQFDVTDFRVIVGKQILGNEAISEAIVRVKIGEAVEHTVADGDGPVHALDGALRKALEPHFPTLRDVHLTDFKVRVINVRAGTAARVRVFVESANEEGQTWTTVGVHENLIVASLEALSDSLHYGLRLAAVRAPA